MFVNSNIFFFFFVINCLPILSSQDKVSHGTSKIYFSLNIHDFFWKILFSVFLRHVYEFPVISSHRLSTNLVPSNNCFVINHCFPQIYFLWISMIFFLKYSPAVSSVLRPDLEFRYFLLVDWLPAKFRKILLKVHLGWIWEVTWFVLSRRVLIFFSLT